jgi:two-component system chemotaxis response regulator CheB
MAAVRVMQRRTPAEPPSGRRKPISAAPAARYAPRLVAIGASTGGPQALQTVLGGLPSDFAPPVLVVQHIAAGFETGLVDWLQPQCALPIRMAADGARPVGPGIYVAPPGRHLEVRGGLLRLSDAAPLAGHRPSATVLFRSVAREYGSRAVGVLLTGMGDDGAAGLLELQAGGGATIAQDAASSAVFGMPAAAIALGAVDQVLPPSGIAARLVELALNGRHG